VAARNETKGKSLMLLTESETHMTTLIQEARVPIKKIHMNKSKNMPLAQKLAQQIAQVDILSVPQCVAVCCSVLQGEDEKLTHQIAQKFAQQIAQVDILSVL